ncbi:hypothetical protein BT63DRAFT_464153 [Microthyrium microscopicum]|uniref:Nucleoporin Nup159/Nup146 N-terminal domain-containing protein n=1 Tax=Microthyrium microscopicum TaxID=703497 RepID=A0A6A6U198_9PEZI|nr:hypothetical protein BT63DRAFT_464153 [Microthyrium microscopicum]
MSFGSDPFFPEGGPERPTIPEIDVTSLGFTALAGDVKVKLPVAWPQDQPPLTTSSLLSIASRKSLLAAAGPSSLLLTSTDRIRKAFKDAAETKQEISDLDPDLVMPVPRLSHVAFTSDESCLILAAESGGGLAAHSVEALINKQTEPAFELPTDGVAVKNLAPNPAPEFAHIVAVLMANGHLMLANFQEQKFGSSIKDGVTSVAWSVRGKQLLAGLEDGTAVQIDMNGNIKATIPKPPSMLSGNYMASIVWLANDEFLTMHCPANPDLDNPPVSCYHYVRTNKDRSQFDFQFSVIEPAFGVHQRFPAAFLTARIREWEPLKDAVFVTTTAASNIGLFTKSTSPLSTHREASEITNTYVFTEMEEEVRRATLPYAQSGDSDTYPIGMSLDYSSKEKVRNPVPGDDTLDESSKTLPALTVLNYEGFLRSWWFVNDAAVQNSIPCPGLAFPEGAATSNAPAQAISPIASQPAQSPFGATGFGSPSQLGKPAAAPAAFGQPSQMGKPAQPAFGASSFGKPTIPAAFGQPSQLGKPAAASAAFGQPSQMGKPAQPAFGASAFGQPAFGAAAFGKPSAPSSFASPTTMAQPAVPFGGNASQRSGFAKFGSPTAASSPFGSMGTTKSPMASPFAAAGGNAAKPAFASGAPLTSTQTSNFGGMSSQPSFGSTVSIDSGTGGSTLANQSLLGNSSFGAPSAAATPFGQQSSFPAPSESKSKEEEMDDDATPQPETRPKLFGEQSPFKAPSLFIPGETAKEKGTEDEADGKSSFSNMGFGSLGLGSSNQEPKADAPQRSLFSPVVKEDPDKPKRGLFDIPEASTSRSPQPGITQTPASPEAKQSIRPEPPQVTSKPASSPATGPSSEESSTKEPRVMRSIENDDAEDDGEGDDEDGSQEEDEEEDEEDEFEDESPEPEDSNHTSEVVVTPPRMGMNQSPPGSGDTGSSPFQPVSTPFSNTPPMPKSVQGLRGQQPYSSSPLGESSGIPPPVPTPPMSGPPRTFPNLGASTTPSGIPPYSFPPPQEQDSPRSPSPVRPPISGPPPSMSQAQQNAVPQPAHIVRSSEQPLPEQAPRNDAVSDLHDDADEEIRALLAQPIEPTLALEPFIAHQDYAGLVSMDGPAGNAERVYRDINSMIDTLGRNSRSLSSFVAGHTELASDALPDGTDLSDHSRVWTLDEVTHLEHVEQTLDQDLVQESVDNILSLLPPLAAVNRSLRSARDDARKMRTFLAAHTDPSARERRRAAPLDPAAATLQRNLNNQLAQFRKGVAEAEAALAMAHAKLVRADAQNAPSVEAVERTIRKMTGMVEKRSGDVDVLEVQLRKLGFMDASVSSLKGSPVRGKSYGVVDRIDEEEDGRTAWVVDVRARRRSVLERVRALRAPVGTP